MKLFVCNLPYALGDDDLLRLFEPYGEILTAFIATDRTTGASRGFGFVTFAKADDAQRAIDALDCFRVRSREISVREADPERRRRPEDDRLGRTA